jgi:hypothetical protein
MAYALHICRLAADRAAEDVVPIPLDEWRAALSATEGVRWFAAEHYTIENPTTRQPIRMKVGEGAAEAFFPKDERWYPAIRWFEGSASFNARLQPGDMTHPVWAAAVSLATRLGAVICGDEGEVYDLETGRVVRDLETEK